MSGKVLELMRKGVQALEAKAHTSELLKVLQSEITHELSSPSFQNDQAGPPEGFALEWDAPYSQDIVLRKKCETGEEVAISALLGPDYTSDETYTRDVRMKVCVRKPGMRSFLQFDCVVFKESLTGPEFCIKNARYLQSSSSRGPSYYTGPVFSHLNPVVDSAFTEYLEARGVGGSLVNFLLLHMHRKEQNQYVNWLQKLQETVSQGESSDSS